MTYYVYVAAEDRFSNPIKIGISNNPVRRMTDLNTAWPGDKPLRVHDTIMVDDKRAALQLEGAVLDHLRAEGVRTKGELAYCLPSQATGIMYEVLRQHNQSAWMDMQMDLFAMASPP